MWQRIWRTWDWVLLLSTIGIVVIGLAVIGSATHINKEGVDNYNYMGRQAIFFAINLAILIGMQRFDYRNLQKWATPLYVVTILMLLAVIFVGTSALGAQRWVQIGPIVIQPSELSKLFIIISLANLLQTRIGKLNTYRELSVVALYAGIPFLLVFRQPDLGTALVFVAITLGMIFVAGVKLKLLVRLGLGAILLAPLGWFLLKEYQKDRILVFLNPNIDPFGAGYHIIQSKIAVGSGMLMGKGLFSGTQSQLDFLPENHTDFIFSVIGEELGFIGCSIVLFLFFLILYRSVQIAQDANDNFGMLIAIGICSMIAFQVLVNVGMTTGIMPVTGIPLPFLSYGVNSLTTNMLSVGLLMNIYLHRKKLMF